MAEKMKDEKTRMKRKKKRQQSKLMKAFIGFLPQLILLVLIAVGVIVALTFKNKGEGEEEIITPYGYEGEEDSYVVENDYLKLEMDAKTTQIAVTVKSSGKVWYSNPIGCDTDPLALSDEKYKIQSPLLMSYSVVQGLETPYNSFSYSTDNGIYEILPEENGIRVNYSLGNLEKEYIIPPVITADEFKSWLALMDQKDSDLIQQYYKKYDLNKLGKKDDPEQLKASYPIIETTVIYVLRDTVKEQTRKKMQELFEAAGYTYENYLADKELDQAEKVSDKPVFNISMIYRLDGDDLVVEIPLKDLEYRSQTPIYTITPLPYFGAGGKNDEGFLLVPEGGGALINFNNGKVTQSSYYANVYGWDMCLSRKAVVHNTRAYYGVFGVAQGDDSFICILDDGRAYAAVQADISGKNNSYNYVNSVYSICSREQYDVGDIANSDIFEFIPELPDEDLVQRYSFIDSGSYVDMAKDYSAYLQKEYEGYLNVNTDAQTPTVVELVGAIDKVKQILGVPVSRPLPLTRFDDAGDIINDLTNEGVDNLSVKLTGWSNGGVNQKVLEHIKPIASLGGKSALKTLISTAGSANATVYLNGITQYAFDSNIFDGFFSYSDAAKLLSKERVVLHKYSHITYAARENDDNSYYLLHTDKAMEMADNLVSYAQGMGAGVSYQDLGMDLSSDFYRKKYYSRQSVLKLQIDHLKKVADAGTPIMVNMGNDYATPFASMVTGMDLRGSEYTILDECVPFFQIAIHGRVNYTGDPINISGNQEDEVLYSAEYGAGLYFTFMHESSFATQKTLYTQYYGSNYDSWKQRMLDIYRRYNAELGHTFNQEMTGHENLSPVLSCTEYADGTKVYVNYGYSDAASPDGTVVPARDYLVVR
ncbi:MAG: hypothetical protein IKS07_07460 [Lachnospiraceae bacterium]|nr:hypothetical protein [Lachnospiraceae bacterium]